MLTRFYFVLSLLILTSTRVKCSNLYVHPKTVYITGSKIAVRCIGSIGDHEITAPFDNDIEWVKLSSSSVISSHPEARVRRDGHQLLFNSTDHSDAGLYCCRRITETCTPNSIVRVVARIAHTFTTLQSTRNSDDRHIIVTKSTPPGMLSLRI